MEKQVRRTLLPMILVSVFIAGLLAISFYYLYNALEAYARGSIQEAFFYTILAVGGLGISLYISYTIRKKTLSRKPPPRIITTIVCKNCDFKTLRKFEKSDYVFKTVENCQKCNEPMQITAVYHEELKK